MKVLFLDIDGVLNCARTDTKLDESFGLFKGMDGLDSRLLERFLRWWDPEYIKIVISSNWRLDGRFLVYLKKSKIDYIDVTQNLGSRRQEILLWLTHHPDVTHYAILDDVHHNFGQPLVKHFVQTSFITGVTDKNLAKINKLLLDETP